MSESWDATLLDKMENSMCTQLSKEVLRLKVTKTGQNTDSKPTLERDDLTTILALYDLNEALQSTSQRSKQIKRLSKDIDLYLPSTEESHNWYHI